MKASDIPTRIAEPFAKDATSSYVRAIPVTTTDPNAASQSLGFPPNTSVPIDAGGSPPDIRDMNGILNLATAWDQWQNAGGPVFYDATFSSAIGGYPKGTILSAAANDGNFWRSTADDNTSDPDTGGANWTGFNPFIGSVPAGFVGTFAMNTPPTGWLECNGASLSRTTYAALFAAIGVVFGSADGTHFNLPDMRGEFARGWDDGRGVDPARTFGTTQSDSFAAHTHNQTIGGTNSADINVPPVMAGHGASGGSGPLLTAPAASSSTGGTETRPTNVALLFAIKY